jgi:hypothetical protein
MLLPAVSAACKQLLCLWLHQKGLYGLEYGILHWMGANR